MCWRVLQLQHCDVVGLGCADQGSWDIQGLLRASGRPVPTQVYTINPHVTLIKKDIDESISISIYHKNRIM